MYQAQQNQIKNFILPIGDAAIEFKQQLEQDWLFAIDTEAIFGLVVGAALNSNGGSRLLAELTEWLFSEGLETKSETTDLQRQFAAEVIMAIARTIQEELLKIGLFTNEHGQYEFIRLTPDSRYVVVRKT